MPRHYLDWSARGAAGPVRYTLGAFAVLLISLVIGQVFSVVGSVLISSDSAAATIVKTTFFGFIVSFLVVPLVPRVLNRRPCWSIAMPRPGVEARNLLLGAGVVLPALAVQALVAWGLDPGGYRRSDVDLSVWLPMLLVVAAAFFVQASTEEMVYRGYLTQFAYRFTRRPVLFLVLPALVFSVPHLGNISGLSGPLALAPYVVAGLTYGWLAYRSGSLWMAVGAHMANNWFLTVFLGSSTEKIEKIALFVDDAAASGPWHYLISALLAYIPVALLGELVLRRTGSLIRPGSAG